MFPIYPVHDLTILSFDLHLNAIEREWSWLQGTKHKGNNARV